MTNPNAYRVEMILHEQPKPFTHNTISQAERWAYIGRYVNTQEGELVSVSIIVEAVRFNGILYLQVGPTELGMPGWN